MSNQEKQDNNPIDVWTSIRNLKRKMKGSKNENEMSSILQKSQNSTKFSSNSSMISHKELNASQISHTDEYRKEPSKNQIKGTATNLIKIQKDANLTENNILEENKSNYCSRKTEEENYCSRKTEDFSEKNAQNNLEDLDYRMESYNSENRESMRYFESLKQENEVLKEENKKMQDTIASLIKENQKSFSNFQKYHQQEYEDKINFYESEVCTLKEAFQKELESKEQEIEMLKSLLSNKSQQNPKTKVNEKFLIQNYENTINMLKNDFQNEIFRMKKDHQKQINQMFEEKSVLEKLLDEKQKEINKLKYFELFANIIPENKENISQENNKLPQKSLRKNHNEKNIENLLSKISKCMNENILTESDFNLTSKNNTRSHFQDRNVLMESGLTTDTMSKLVVAEEFPLTEYSENEEVHELPHHYKETDANLSVEQEDAIWMNNSIKNLNEKIRMNRKR